MCRIAQWAADQHGLVAAATDWAPCSGNRTRCWGALLRLKMAPVLEAGGARQANTTNKPHRKTGWRAGRLLEELKAASPWHPICKVCARQPLPDR